MSGLVEAAIFVAVVWWLVCNREFNMVDMVVGTCQKLYSTVDTMMQRTNMIQYEPELSSRITKVSVERLRKSLPRNQRRIVRKQIAEQSYEKTIYEDLPLEVQNIFSGKGMNIKEQSPFMRPLMDNGRPVMGSACLKCTQHEGRPSLLSRVAHQHAIQNVLAVETNRPSCSYFEQLFCHLIAIWRQKTHYYPHINKTVLEDERLIEAINEATDEDLERMKTNGEETDGDVYDRVRHRHYNRAMQIVSGMKSSISDTILRMMAWLVYKLIPRFIMSVSSQPAQIDWLRNNRDLGLPMIFLPLHRSHLDYILITFILLRNNIQAPLVAAGDNLKIPFFGWLLGRLGAFFIKRRLDPVQGRRDIVYRAVLHTYMMECLRAGHNIEFFLEGGRTRTGKPCMPKGGLLSVIVDAYMDGTINDALLVPVSLNYEKLVDGNFVREQLGQPKEMESFNKAISAIWNVLNSSYGMMRIDFHQPFSLKELILSVQANTRHRTLNAIQKPLLVDEEDGHLTVKEKADNFHQTPSSTSLYGTDICHEEHRQLVEAIARHVIYDCTQSTAVMSTNAVSFLLLNKFRNGVSLPLLVNEVAKLRDELRLTHRDVGFSGETIDVVNHALDLLGPGLIHKEKAVATNASGQTETETIITPITMLPNVIELSYYSNPVLSHYIMDSVVATSVYSLIGNEVEEKTEATSYLYHEDIKQGALLVCDILQYEFIFAKPCQDIDNLVSDAIERLQHKDILMKQQEPMDEDIKWSRNFAKYLEAECNDFSDEASQISDKGIEYTLVSDKKTLEHLNFLHTLLRPLMDTYVISALCLSRLVGRQLTEREYTQEVLAEMKTQYDRGALTYGESVAVDPIKASFKLFEHWQVLECHSEEKVKLYYLAEKYDRESEVRRVFDIVNQFKWGPQCNIEVFD